MLEEIDLRNYFCEGQMEIEDYMEEHKKMENQIIMLALGKIKHHPKNPRKNIGDVTELAESIKKNGIMQNLTVMHDPDDPEGYICLIGHRRMTAAAQAGLEEVPCRVVQIDEKEQIAMMLQENIQRNDLTIPEQAYGFQYMFDLGASADEIAEKTGLNRSTVYHRLNIAKLDKETLEAKANDENFQLTFKDLMELEKVEDLNDRNRVLKESRNRNDLITRVNAALRMQKMRKNAKILKEAMEAEGIQEAPEEYKKNRWSDKYTTWKTIWLDEKPEIPQMEDLKELRDRAYYDIDANIFRIVIKNKEIEEAPKKSKWDIKREKQKECCRKTEEFTEQMLSRLKGNIRLIYNGKLISKNYENTMEIFWGTLVSLEARLDLDKASRFFLEKDKPAYKMTQEEKEEGIDWFNGQDPLSQMAIMLYAYMSDVTCINWNGSFREYGAKEWITGFEAFREFGIEPTPEEKAFLDGTSDMYYREEEEPEDEDDDDWDDDDDEEEDDE